MDSAKHSSSTDAELSFSTSTEEIGTARIRLRNVADSHDEDGRKSAGPEKRALCQTRSFTGSDLTSLAESNTTQGLGPDFARGVARIKPGNRTWDDFFWLPPAEEGTSSSIPIEARQPIELHHNTEDISGLSRAASEGSVPGRLSVTSIGTPAQQSTKQPGDRCRLSSTLPRTEPKRSTPTPGQHPIWPGFHNPEYSSKPESEWHPKSRSPKPIYELLQCVHSHFDTTVSVTDSAYVGNRQGSTKQDKPTRIVPRSVIPDLHDRSTPGTTHILNTQQATLAATRPLGSDDMAAGFQRMSGDARKYPSSNHSRTENRPPMSNVLCRNGPQCRKFQEGYSDLNNLSNDADLQLTGTCNFNHDFSSISADVLGVAKKSLNVDSPAFTPTLTPNIGNAQPAKIGISPKAATAAAFTPRGSGTVTPARQSHSKEPSAEFIPQQAFQPTQQFNEFVPGQSFIAQQQMDPQSALQSTLNAYGDPFLSQPGIANLDGAQPQLNPYTATTPGVSGQQFFQDTSSYKHPLSYHLYASIGPRRENLMAYQRSTSDFFVPDNLREDLQRKAEATLQTFANSTLPQSVEYFHSLVALDTNNQKGPMTFGYPSWVYKATSSRDGHTYALRRIEGFRLTSEAAIRTVQNWKRVSNSSLVQVHDAFTGRWFNDSSLIIVTDYHPMSQTLVDKHFALGRHAGANRSSVQITPENELWAYIIQIGSALKAIHDGGLAAQTVIPSKVLVTSKNRVRLSGCGILDIVQYDHRKPLNELQRSDLEDLGRLMLGIAARNQTAHNNVQKALDVVSRSYTERLRACIAWLLTPPPLPQDSMAPSQQPESQASSDYNINILLNNIADKVISAFDSALHLEDELTSNFMRELENGRLVRLLTKLNVILERPESSNAPGSQPTNPNMLNQPSTAWSETGERYYLKLFRDYVFHQVDHDGRPVLDLGHILACLNKLDAGVDEKVQLVSRDEQNVFIVTYREVKRGFESAWADISKASNTRR